MPVPFYVHSALSNSLEHVRGYGLGRDDGTVQVAHIADGRLYTAGVVSNLFRVRNVSDSTGPATLAVKLPPQIVRTFSVVPAPYVLIFSSRQSMGCCPRNQHSRNWRSSISPMKQYSRFRTNFLSHRKRTTI